MPENNAEGSRSAALEPSKPLCQTDSPHQTGSYSRSRFNACTWQSRREEVMVCPGEDRCRYCFCSSPGGPPPVAGYACVFETWFAHALAAQFEKDLPRNRGGRYLGDEYDYWRKEYIVAHLLSNRVAVRFSRSSEEWEAWALEGGAPSDLRPFHHFTLASRYWTAAHNRIAAFHARLTEIGDQARGDRIISKMIESGYWQPWDGSPRPNPADAPVWIVEMVDAG